MKIKNTSGITVKIHIYDKYDAVRAVARDAFLLDNGQERLWPATANSYIVTVFKPAFFDEYLTHRLVGKNETMEIKTASGGSVFGHLGSTVVDTFGPLPDAADDIVASAAAILKSMPKALEAEWKKAERAIGAEWDKAIETVEGWGNEVERALIKPVSDVIVDASEDGEAAKVLRFLANIKDDLTDMAEAFNTVLTSAAQFAMNRAVIDCVRSIAMSPPVRLASDAAKQIGIGGGFFIGLTTKVEGVSQFAVGATGELEIGYVYFFEGPEKDNVLGLANFSAGAVFGPPGGDADLGLTVGFVDADMLSYPLFVVVDGQISTPGVPGQITRPGGGLGVNYVQGLPINIHGGPPPVINKFGDGAGLTGYFVSPSPELEGKLSLSAGYLWAWGRGSAAQSGRGASTSGSTILSDAADWNDVSNYSTIQTAVVDDRLYLLARGNNGMYTWMWNGNLWIQISGSSPRLGDREGWNDVSYYSTIQTAVVDHTLYLLARANSGMWMWRLDGSQWIQVRASNPPWRDPEWGSEANYSTIQTAVAVNTLFLMGMSDTGMETWKFSGTDWTPVSKRDPITELWPFVSNYSTIQVAPASNTLYMVARSRSGIITWRLDDDRWVMLSNQMPPWNSPSGWNQQKHYSTIQLVSLRDRLFLLGRAGDGMHTWYHARNSVTGQKSWEMVQRSNPPWSDANGWNFKIHYSTIQAVAHKSSLYLIARARNGIHTWRLDAVNSASLDRGWQQLDFGNPPWGNNPGGWEDPTNNDTIQLVSAGGELYLLGRADSGLHMWQLVNDQKWERVY